MARAAVLVGPGGFIGKYRKAHLWNREKLWFTPGNLGFPVFDTPIGRIGLLICWDIWFPEVPRLLSLQGADIICSLNNWVWTPPPLFDATGKCMASYLTITAAPEPVRLYEKMIDQLWKDALKEKTGASQLRKLLRRT